LDSVEHCTHSYTRVKHSSFSEESNILVSIINDVSNCYAQQFEDLRGLRGVYLISEVVNLEQDEREKIVDLKSADGFDKKLIDGGWRSSMISLFVDDGESLGIQMYLYEDKLVRILWHQN
jgi:hypothetical protein